MSLDAQPRISIRTVSAHPDRIWEKTAGPARTGLTRLTLQAGLI